MKKAAIILMAAACCLNSCTFVQYRDGNANTLLGKSINPSGNYKTQSYDASDFDKVFITIPAEIVYIPGNHLVEINAPDNYIEHIVVSNNDSLLSITNDGTRFTSVGKGDITITLSSDCLRDMTINGAADFHNERPITTDSFKTTVNGAADVTLNGIEAESVDITINGAADMDIKNLQSNSLSVDVNGAGSGNINGKVTGKAEVSVKGAGDIDIRQLDAADLTTSVKGAGSIRKK